jgi:hypothetical protein
MERIQKMEQLNYTKLPDEGEISLDLIPDAPLWVGQSDLLKNIRIGKATLSYHLKKWYNDGLITQKNIGRKKYWQKISMTTFIPPKNGEFVFTIKDSNATHSWDNNNHFFNQWRKQLDRFSIEFITNVMLASADIIRERNSLEKKK